MSHVERPGRGALAQFDPAVPHPARVYNVWLDGKDHFESDRAVAAKVIERRPQVVDGAVANRQFLGRVAQLVDPYSRVLYIDSDPLVMTHARALLASADEGSCDYLHADLRDTEYILKEARRTVDFNLPVAVLLLAVLHFIDDKDNPAGIVTALVGPLTAGSSVVISHLTADSAPEAVGGGVAAYNALVPTAIYPRTHSRVTELFGDLSLVPPGVVPVSEWRPDAIATQVTDVYAGMARKRERRAW
jgi:hypothetical protein